MKQRRLLSLFATVLLTLLFQCEPPPHPGPRHENTIYNMLPIMPKKEKGVHDIGEIVRQRVSADVSLVSATYDVRPTWCDGAARYLVVVQFPLPGRYTVVMARDGREQTPHRRELTIRVRERQDASPGISVDAVFHPESDIVEAAPGQQITLFWNGNGGRAPAWVHKREWDLLSIESSR